MASCKGNKGLEAQFAFPSEEKYNAFAEWWLPQYKSLKDWENDTCYNCSALAIYAINAGVTKYDKVTSAAQDELTKEIQKYVEDEVQKSKDENVEIISHKQALTNYVNSVEGFEEAMRAWSAKSGYDYWSEVQDILN